MNLTLDQGFLLFFVFRSLLLEVFVVCGDGHKLVLVCRVKIIPWLIIGFLPDNIGCFGQTNQVHTCPTHSQTDEEELWDEARVPLSMLYSCPKYHLSSF